LSNTELADNATPYRSAARLVGCRARGMGM
jgi:hypothetical protein